MGLTERMNRWGIMYWIILPMEEKTVTMVSFCTASSCTQEGTL